MSTNRRCLSLVLAVLCACGALVGVAVLVAGTTQPIAVAAERQALPNVGPGRVDARVHASDPTLGLLIAPNRSAATNSVVLSISSHGQPVRRAAVTVNFTMLEMSMGTSTFPMPERRPGQYVYNGPATTMPGNWQLAFRVKLRSGQRLTTSVQDRVN